MPNPKGSNGGGGMRKGQKTRRTLEREERERALVGAQQAARAADKTAGKKLAEDVLNEGMNYFFGLAAYYQPTDTNKNRDEKKFEGYLMKAVTVAGKLQPYQMQRLPPQQFTQTPLDLTKLSTQELDELERLHAKAAVSGGDQSGTAAKVH